MDQGNTAKGITHETIVNVASGVSSAVENRADKQAKGECVRKRCSAEAADGSDYCAKHRDEQRAYQRGYMARLRAKRRAKRLCTWCGKRLPRRLWPGRDAQTASCDACRIKRDRMGARGVKQSVENHASRVAARVVTAVDGSDGYARTRLRGGKRGAPKAEQLDDADLRDLRLYIEKAAAGIAVANSEEVQALPRIQRDEAKYAAMSWVALLVRSGLAFMKRKGVPLPSQANHILEGEMGGTDGKTGR